VKENRFKKAEPTESPEKSRSRAATPRLTGENWEKIRKTAGAFLMLFSLFLLISIISHILYAGSSDQSALLAEPTTVSNQGGWFGAYFSTLFVTRGFGYIAILLPFYFALLGYALFEGKYWGAVRRFLAPLSFWLYWVSVTLAFFTLAVGGSSQDWGGGIGLFLAELLRQYIGLFGLGFLVAFSLFTYVVFKYNDKWAFLAFARPWVARMQKRLVQEVAEIEQPASGENVARPPKPATEAAEGEEDVLEDEFFITVKKAEPRPGSTAPVTAEPEFEVIRKPKPEFLKPAHLVQDELELALSPEMLEQYRMEGKANHAAEGELPFEIEVPQRNPQHTPGAGLQFSIELPEPRPLAGDNIQEVGAERYEKIIAPEDQALLADGETVEDELYDPRKDLSQYRFPTLELLDVRENPQGAEVNREELEANKNKIVKTLADYSIDIVSIKATIGPTVTLYEIVPAPGIRISKIKNLEDDIALSLAAMGIRIIAPMPGKGTIGIEIPNSKPEIVDFRSLLATEKFRNTPAELPIAIGKTISNEVYIADLAKMPHLLVAGATGQGKSVGLNCILASLLYKKHPSQVKFVLIDPKKVEMTLYQQLEKHFLAKLPNYEESIITDNKQVIHVLNSLCIEMDNRYELLKEARVRALSEYNAKFQSRKLNPQKGHAFLPYIVLVIDELADLMMTAGKEIETPIARLAQLARAVGIHLVVATQRPSVNVITGTIKANFPTRMSYRVISKVDSRTILDANGAEQLIGRGDVLYFNGSELIRLQNAFIDTHEVDRVVQHIALQQGYPQAYLLPEYSGDEDALEGEALDPNEMDSMFADAARLVVSMQLGSTSLLQRRLKLGYNRAGRIMDQLERAGIVGPGSGSKPREVLVGSEYELEEYLSSLV
jgi:S-DNA-T family DNA segregation ATPase FtsK/SpoIIIE